MNKDKTRKKQRGAAKKRHKSGFRYIPGGLPREELMDAPDDDTFDEQPNLPKLHSIERTMHDLYKLLQKQDFAGEQELKAFLDNLMDTDPGDLHNRLGPKDKKDQAQELMYDAMDTEDPYEQADLMHRALTLDPDCVDAIVLQASFTDDLDEAIEILSEAVATGEHSLGKTFFRENKGHFWGIFETRPYMRARAALADCLRQAGRLEEAIAHFGAMLELNPNDNQGIRDSLLGCYLLKGDLKGTRRLLKKYDGDWSAIFNWSRVLERYLSGDLNAAAKSLQKAHKQNIYVASYLAGKKRLPERLPDYYSPGDKNEAIHCADTLAPAWKKHSQAQNWLRETTMTI